MGWTVHCRKPRGVLAVTVARMGLGDASTRNKLLVVKGGRLQRLAAYFQEVLAGPKEKFRGKPKVVQQHE